MKQSRFSLLSLVLSVAAFFATLVIDYHIVLRYKFADGKTQALFGLIEYLSFSYKYYLLLPALLSVAVALFAFRKNEPKRVSDIAFLVALFSNAMVFVQLWRLFI